MVIGSVPKSCRTRQTLNPGNSIEGASELAGNQRAVTVGMKRISNWFSF